MAWWSSKKADAAKAANGHRVIVAPAGDDWVVQISGHFPAKTSAVLIGRAVAGFLDLEYQEHGESGRIQRKDSSGNAPDDPRIPG